MRCVLCNREAVGNLCPRHLGAKVKLDAGYARWVRAYGQMKWEDYLDKVKRCRETGRWAKEVAEMLEGNRHD